MKVVVGLGNPGLKHAKTRHNLGWMVVGELARRHGAVKAKLSHEAEIADVFVAAEKTLLVAPQTYMNLSGRSVRKVVDFYQLSLDDMLVVSDDLNLDTGQIRMRPAGSAGGQKGIQDIITRLGTDEFARLRIGIGRPPGRIAATDYVLGRFRSEEREPIEQAVMLAADGVETWIQNGLDAAMNKVNAPRDA